MSCGYLSSWVSMTISLLVNPDGKVWMSPITLSVPPILNVMGYNGSAWVLDVGDTMILVRGLKCVEQD